MWYYRRIMKTENRLERTFLESSGEQIGLLLEEFEKEKNPVIRTLRRNEFTKKILEGEIEVRIKPILEVTSRWH